MACCLAVVLVVVGCGHRPSAGSTGLKVVATSTIVGDVVRSVAGDHADVSVLMAVGADPHDFEPAPRDLAAVSDADIVFANGAGYETFLAGMMANAKAPAVELSAGLATRTLGQQTGLEAGQHPGDVDPHVWFDPTIVAAWTDKIAETLSADDPANAAAYAAAAADYKTQLADLDAWIKTRTATVSADRRTLVTDHIVLGYFADRYGFDQVGAVIPSVSSAAQPSARELAQLMTTIKDRGVPAIFVSSAVNPGQSERLAADAGIRVVPLYTESLTKPGGAAPTYLELMRFDTQAIVDALMGK